MRPAPPELTLSWRIRAILAALLTAVLGAGVAPAQDPSAPGKQPTQVVDALDDTLTSVMKDAKTLGYSGRFDRLSPVIHQLFNLDFMAQKIAGRHWKSMSPEDRERLVDAFSRYTIANYAGRFSSWSGQEFQGLGEEPSARGTVLVHTKLLDPEGEDVKLDYRLRHTDAGGWQIIDIYFNGTVSELALRRAEYSSLIKREGLEALLTALDERIAELASTPQDPA
ncbi:MAG: ABC transporter substrate-binding protein [Myxococcota bacterium]|jgi:phospholipid transport system substrate-binding protein|nr:hypothetical protein [Deltaproteobacteria bacterium]MCP4242843.1 hypothetical protein [bacterium]MDP6075684.1 ABC transporter substrate-binding protein [Myxococcota bacterium]MDP6243479.1 ABC transporter substrate-binding protein [Myxococcota bacterium]MDP7075428.1 ABC transporter substrate-binding protein [Myxococcota bacterium]